MSIFEYDEELHQKTLLAEGYEDGFQDGFQDGELNTLVRLISKKIFKHKSLDTIAEELEQDPSCIRPIYDAIISMDTPTDEKQILEYLKNTEKKE